jgi:HEAT repeat protein
MTNPLTEMSGQQIGRLIAALDSLMDGELAVEMLIACGQPAIPYLADFLLKGSPRTISLPRCRAARALGELGARSTLIAYFKDYGRPQDGAVLFAEDAVRSTIARELARWNSDEVFQVLLDAAAQRVTGGVVLALGDFHRPESIPLLFEVLEDDLCREDAMKCLRGLSDATRQFGILAIRGLTGVTLEGADARCRKRATLQLLSELGVAKGDWPDLYRFLWESDPGTVIAAAQIGFTVAPDTELPEVVIALLEIAKTPGFVQEDEVQQLLDAHSGIAREIALQIAKQRKNSGEKPNWLSPSWRILNHVLGRSLESGHPTGA